MFQFPSVDPIPLPAPVWLFKLLSVVTLLLHFIAVQLMIGGLSLSTLWNIISRKDSASQGASNAIMRKLPSVMTYVINFGVPPLLFAQVLYGRALYTSSVLIGFYWISVIVVLTLTYFSLYRSVDRSNDGRKWWGFGLLSWAGVIYIAKIFSINMTLMLRPEDWQSIYQAGGGLGAILPTGDPTTTPRFLFMLAGSFGFSGMGLLVLSAFGGEKEDVTGFLRRWGSIIAITFLILQSAAGVWVFRAQPVGIQSAMMSDPMTYYAILGWAAFTVVALLGSIAVVFGGVSKVRLLSFATVLFGILATASFILVRDSIRDLTLLSKGFDVWQRTVVSNWSVVLLFLGLFVGGLALIGVLLVAISRSAKKLAAQTAGSQLLADGPVTELLEESDD